MLAWRGEMAGRAGKAEGATTTEGAAAVALGGDDEDSVLCDSGPGNGMGSISFTWIAGWAIVGRGEGCAELGELSVGVVEFGVLLRPSLEGPWWRWEPCECECE